MKTWVFLACLALPGRCFSGEAAPVCGGMEAAQAPSGTAAVALTATAGPLDLSPSAAASDATGTASAVTATAAPGPPAFIGRSWRSFLYGIFGLDKCYAQSGEPTELYFKPDGTYSLAIGSPEDGPAFSLHRGRYGSSVGQQQMGEPGGAFTVKPYAQMSAAEIQAALDRIWAAEHCGLGGGKDASWYFAKVDGQPTQLTAVHSRAEADEELKARLAQWNPLYFSSEIYAGFLLPAERVGVLK